MKATITGTDSLSQRIILDLRRGVKVSAIPEMYPVSLDQAKRLSRYSKLLLQAEANLHKEAYEKVEMLGLKVLPLAKLFRSGDWEGISEILSGKEEINVGRKVGVQKWPLRLQWEFKKADVGNQRQPAFYLTC